MPPLYMRAGPSGTDLRNTSARDDELSARLTGAGLAVLRVEVNQLTDQVTVVWRTAPGSEAKAIAEDLIGQAEHVW